jgi:teichuronic acid biosynthesis glycosyltransferase TuaG
VHLVDVIIPTRNRLKQTVEAVTSVQGQTDGRWHLYLVDDASDDGSYEELLALYKGDPKITVLRHVINGRAARARQTGFDAGCAEWIATLDSDDVWVPEKLELQLAAAGQHDVVLGWHSWIRPDGSVRVTRRPAGVGRVSPLLTSNVDVAMMRRAVIDRVGGFAGAGALDLAADENIDFFIRLLASADVVIVEEVLARCRDHGSRRTSDSMTPETLQQIIDAHRGLLEPWPKDFGPFLCRLGARYLAAGQKRRGLRCTIEGLRMTPLKQRPVVLREFGPHAIRTSLRKPIPG